MRRLLPLLLLLAAPAQAEVYIWVDAEGRTHISDDPAAVPEDRRDALISEGAELDALWDRAWAEPLEPAPGRGGDGRVERLLRGAVGDLQRGNSARARGALENVLELEPGNPEAHFHLALLARQRGRLDQAQAHLEAFLAHAGDDLEPWRASAKRRLEALDDERRLAAEQDEPLELLAFESPHFRVHFDARLGETSPDYGYTVLRYLEQAREHALDLLGVRAPDPTGVVLYGKAAYLRAHAHRFSFQTVGFFDGRIHVVSAAHPAGELRALLFHEYAHAAFREHAGGDRPFWLNEGLAELAERASRRTRLLARSDLALLRARIRDGDWIPLRRLSAGFAGLSDGDARLAYLEAAAAARWLGRTTQPSERGRLLAALDAAASTDAALRSVLGLDVDGVDAAVRADVMAEFAPAAWEQHTEAREDRRQEGDAGRPPRSEPEASGDGL